MKKQDFFQSLYNSALYFKSQKTYVAVYIGNLRIVDLNLFLINELEMQLAPKFKTADLGPTADYLGRKVF